MLVFLKTFVWGPFRDGSTVKTTRNGLQDPCPLGWGPLGGFEGDSQVLPGGTLEVKNLNLGGNWGQMRHRPFLKYAN